MSFIWLSFKLVLPPSVPPGNIRPCGGFGVVITVGELGIGWAEAGGADNRAARSGELSSPHGRSWLLSNPAVSPDKSRATLLAKAPGFHRTFHPSPE